MGAICQLVLEVLGLLVEGLFDLMGDAIAHAFSRRSVASSIAALLLALALVSALVSYATREADPPREATCRRIEEIVARGSTQLDAHAAGVHEPSRYCALSSRD